MYIEFREGFYLVEDYLGNNVYIDQDGYLVYKYKHPKFVESVVLGVRFNKDTPSIIDIYLEGLIMDQWVLFPEMNGNSDILSLRKHLADYRMFFGKETPFDIIKEDGYKPVIKSIYTEEESYVITYSLNCNDTSKQTKIFYKFNKEKENVIEVKVIGTFLEDGNVYLPSEIIGFDTICNEYYKMYLDMEFAMFGQDTSKI